MHGGEPAVDYATLWALWLSAVPYGLWSERVSRPSMEEHVRSVERLERALAGALAHFGLDAAGGHHASTTSPARSRAWSRACG